jgi:hypothetical protein
MRKQLLIAAAVAALALPTVSVGALADPREEACEHHEISPEDQAAFTDARVAALKAGLKLTSAQEKHWPALEAALRDAAKAHAARAAQWREKCKEDHEHRNLIDMLRFGATSLSARGAELGKIADAAKPLYDSLEDAQKHRFGILMHVILKPHHHWAWRMRQGAHSGDGADAEHEE